MQEETHLEECQVIVRLDQLAGQARVAIDPHAAREAARQALREVPEEADGRLAAVLTQAGEDLGLRVRANVNAGGQLKAAATPATPMEMISARGAAAGHPTPGGLHGVHPSGGDGGQGHHPRPERRLLELMRAQMPDIWVLVVYAGAVGLLSLATPIAVQALVNSVSFGTVIQPVIVLTLVVFFSLGAAGLLRLAQISVVEIMQQRLFVQVTADLAHRLPRTQRAAFDRQHGPELLNRFFDVLTVQKAASVLLLDGVALVLQTVIGLLVLGFYHPVFLAFNVLLLGGIAVVFGLGRGATRSSIDESRAKYAVAAWLEEVALHGPTFASRPGAALAAERADDLARSYVRARQAHFRILLRQIGGAVAFQALMNTALLGLGAWLVVRRQLTIGQLVAAELIVSALVAGLAKFGKQLESYYDLLAATDKLGHLADLPLERRGGERPRVGGPGADVHLRGVSLQYEGGPTVLAQVDLDLPPGARVAIFGETASGKSTLAELVCGLRPPTQGTVALDGADLRDLSLPDVRAQVALVGAPQIFHGSAIENVTLGRPGVGPAEARAALRAVGLLGDEGDGEASALPDGLRGRLTPTGSPLSAGQAQLLMLARALCAAPRLLVVDGALDGLDGPSRDAALAALRGGGWTLLLLTREPALAAHCDIVHHLHEGGLRPAAAKA